MALEAVGDENRPKFFNANSTVYLKINISLTFFAYSWAKLNVVYVFKKNRPKS